MLLHTGLRFRQAVLALSRQTFTATAAYLPLTAKMQVNEPMRDAETPTPRAGSTACLIELLNITFLGIESIGPIGSVGSSTLLSKRVS